MSDLFKEILSMSLSGSLLVLLILLLKPLLKERFSKAWQYYIWIIVLIRLVLPYSPEFGIIDSLFQPVAVQSSSEAETDTQGNYIHTEDSSIQSIAENSAENSGGNSTDNIVLPAVKPEEHKEALDGFQIGTYLWLAGMAILFFLKLIKYLHFLAFLKSSSEPVADKRTVQIYKSAALELGITRVPQLKLNSQIASPMLLGLIKPSVYLTDITLDWDDTSLYYVLRHELMHYKRHDIWYKWCCGLVSGIHWFNPVILIMNRQISKQCEISCDEAVARDLSKEEKLLYGNVLLNAISENRKKNSPMLSLTLSEDKKSMKERIKSIIMSNRKSKKIKILSAIVTASLCIAAFWLGAYTMDGGENTVLAADGQNTGSSVSSNSKSAAGSRGDTKQYTKAVSASEKSSGKKAAVQVGNGSSATENVTSGTTVQASVSEGTAKSPKAKAAAATAKNSKSETTIQASVSEGTAKSPKAKAATTVKSSKSETTTPNKKSTNTNSTKSPKPAAPKNTGASAKSTLTYSNKEYGFNFTLPSDWKGYTIVKGTWEGTSLTGKQSSKVTQKGTELLLRNPKWTKKNPYQDIPIMVFTKKQWKLIEKEELAVSAAPISPSKLGSNSKYVFALPARYNFAFPAGYKEVEKIMKNNPLTPTENIK